MEIRSIRHVWGPNVWADADVAVAEIAVPHDAGDRAATTAGIDAAWPARRALFGDESGQTAGPGGDSAAAWATLLAQVMLALQGRARPPATRFHAVVPGPAAGVVRVVVESRDPGLAEECLRQAAEILAATRAGTGLDMAALERRLVREADDLCIGPSTMLIVAAAVERGIPWRRLGEHSLVQLGQGVRQRRIWTAVTGGTPAIAESISRDKQLTKRLLEAAGVPVPRGRVVESAAEAWEAAQAVGTPVVVKPLDGNHGRGVFIGLSTRDEIESAFAVASDEGRHTSSVVVEQLAPGIEHRLLVVGGKMVACAQGEALYVTGDGRRTVAELIDLQINRDARRGRSETMPNKPVDVDETVLVRLAQQGVEPTTVLPPERRVLVKQNGSHGPDVTDQVHPAMAVAAVRAARAVGLDIAGIDLVATDISLPPDAQGAKICEVNAGPQLLVHSNPATGPVRPVGAAIVAELFGPGADGRIPVVAIMGEGATTTALAVDRMLCAAGRIPGLTCATGKSVGGARCGAEPHVTTDAARDLLVAPDIDAAVCELDWRSVARDGLPTDRIDVLVLLPLPPVPADAAPDESPLAVAELAIRRVPSTGTIVIQSGHENLRAAAARVAAQVVEVSATGDAATAAVGSLPTHTAHT
jgi:cyanophycin synthetase